MIRVVCVDDDPLVRSYLEARLSGEGDIELVASLENAGSAFALLRDRDVDIVLLDYMLMNSQDGTQLLQALTLLHEGTPERRAAPAVLFCTGWADAEFEHRVREMGARGVVAKARVASELVAAIRSVAGGGVWFDAIGRYSDSPPAGRSWKILVAAHERPLRALLSDALPKIGCLVTMAYHNEEIVASLERESFDLLLIDHRLPGRLCGAALLEEVSGRHPNLPILFLTTTPGDLAHYRPCSNIQGVVTKPVSIPQLQAEVGRALSWGDAAAAAAP